jgi:hypothetical protein
MRPARLYHIFPHYLQHGKIFEEKVTEHTMWFDFYSSRLKYFSFYEKYDDLLP